jgi:hypothetical protein
MVNTMANGNSLGTGQEKNMPWWLAVARLPRPTGCATRQQSA